MISPDHTRVVFHVFRIENVGSWSFAQIDFQKLMPIFGPALLVGIFSPGFIDQSDLLNMVVDFMTAEVGLEVGVLERVVVGERHFIDVVAADERLLSELGRRVVSSHAVIKLMQIKLRSF